LPKSGSNDTAQLHGTARNDRFRSTSVYSRLAGKRDDGSNYFHRLVRFDQVVALGYGGTDVAQIYDSRLSDTLEATPTETRQYNLRMEVTVNDFTKVEAFAVYGGDDTAYLSGYNPDRDTLIHKTGAETGQPVTRLRSHLYSIKVQNYKDQYADPIDPWSMNGQSAAALLTSTEPDIGLTDSELAALAHSHAQVTGSASGGCSQDERNKAVDAVLQTEIWQ
jgi:hypothetical protein